MVVAVVAVRMVQAAVDQEIDMVAVRHFLMAAIVVLALARGRRAGIRVGRADRQDVLAVMAVVFGVQVAIVQVIDVPVVLDTCVPTVLAVDVLVIVVDVVAHWTVLLGIGEGVQS
jgi:hypothetical protein